MRRLFPYLFLTFISYSCMGPKNHLNNPEVEVIGHRGHVSTYPENTIEGFISLIDTGADALELDLVISGDKQVVVSHEPYMAASYMRTPDGRRIKKSEQNNYLLYHMNYDSIRRFDSGSSLNLSFPKQKRIPSYKPLLKEVFSRVEAHSGEHSHRPLTYYLELKSVPGEYGISQPYPKEFADLVMEVVHKNQMEDRVVLKSFDAQLLNVLKSEYPEAKISFLLYKKSIEEGLAQLNFKPDIISPHYKQLKGRERVLQLQEQGFKVLTWTVNRQRHIRRMMSYGVDGIISDYPERVMKEKKSP